MQVLKFNERKILEKAPDITSGAVINLIVEKNYRLNLLVFCCRSFLSGSFFSCGFALYGIDGSNSLDGDGDPSLLGIDLCNLSLNFLSDMESILRLVESLRRDLGNVAESVEVGLKLNESTELCKTYNSTLNDAAERHSLFDVVVRIILKSLVAEGDLLCILIEGLNIDLNLVTYLENVRGLSVTAP